MSTDALERGWQRGRGRPPAFRAAAPTITGLTAGASRSAPPTCYGRRGRCVMPLGDSRIYYFEVGQGRWHGKFSFRVTSWWQLRAAPIGLTNRIVVVGTALFSQLAGTARISSEIVGHLDQGNAGI